MTDIDALSDLTRRGLRHLAKSVSVITLSWKGHRFAMAATAVEGLSLDPPSMLICVNRTAFLAMPLSQGADFCINLLGPRHLDLPAQCSSPHQGEERFTTGDWTPSACGLPQLDDAKASFLCANERHIEYGTQVVVIGRVRNVSIAAEVEPLVYADAGYHGLLPVHLGDA